MRNKILKTKGVFFKLSPIEFERLDEITENLGINNSHFLRMCIDLFWMQIELEKNGEVKEKFQIGDQLFTLNLVELAQFQTEMAQIFEKVNWTELITMQTKTRLKRPKKAIKTFS